jgi:hypothetical protein
MAAFHRGTSLRCRRRTKAHGATGASNTSGEIQITNAMMHAVIIGTATSVGDSSPPLRAVQSLRYRSRC